jgi:hypothetical protein
MCQTVTGDSTEQTLIAPSIHISSNYQVGGWLDYERHLVSQAIRNIINNDLVSSASDIYTVHKSFSNCAVGVVTGS